MQQDPHKGSWFSRFLQKYSLGLLLGILLLATLLRFVNYDNRWGLAADQARDVLVARQSVALHSLPLIGPFSASGPYVFGPYWYWVLMIPISLFPQSLLAPWFFLTTLFVGSVLVLFLLGKKLISTEFGLLLALLMAISPVEIQLSTNLIMSAFVECLSVVIYFLFVKYLQDKKEIFLYSMAFLIGIAINTHFEAIPLTILLFLALLFSQKSLKKILLSCIFLLLPFIPLAIFNFQSNSYELTHILQTNAPTQHVSFFSTLIAFAKREVLFVVNKYPITISRTVLTDKIFYSGYIVLAILVITLLVAFIKKQLPKPIAVLVIAWLCLIGIIGAYGGTIFQNFLAYMRPLHIILVGWVCWYVIKHMNKYVGFAMIGCLIIGASLLDYQYISQATNTTASITNNLKNKLTQLYPDESFSFYSYTEQNKDKALALSLFLSVDSKIKRKGMKVGFAYFGAPLPYPILFEGPNGSGLRMYNLTNATSTKLKSEGFILFNQAAVYSSVENWYK